MTARRPSRARFTQHGSDGEVDGSSSDDERPSLKASVKKVVDETVKKVENLQKSVSPAGKKE